METFNSILGNFKERVTNPFFATLIGVWLVRNWELVYTLFNFDEDCDLLYKTEFIRNYFLKVNVWLEGWRNIKTAFIIMLIGYLVLIISKTIVYFVQYRIIPHIKKFASSNLVITKTTYDAVRKSRDEISEELINQREISSNLDNKNSILRAENESLSSTVSNRENEIAALSETKTQLDSTIKTLRQSLEIKDTERFEIDKKLLLANRTIENYKADFNVLREKLMSVKLFDNVYPLPLPEFIAEDYINLQDADFKTLNMYNTNSDDYNPNSSVSQGMTNRLIEMDILRPISQVQNTKVGNYHLTEYGKTLIEIHQHNNLNLSS